MYGTKHSGEVGPDLCFSTRLTAAEHAYTVQPIHVRLGFRV